MPTVYIIASDRSLDNLALGAPIQERGFDGCLMADNITGPSASANLM
jgi:hypothetical protein